MFGTNIQNCPRAFPTGGWPLQRHDCSATIAKRGQFLKSVTHQQALLQIYEDFCMQDNSDCAQCPFPEQMAKWSCDTVVSRMDQQT